MKDLRIQIGPVTTQKRGGDQTQYAARRAGGTIGGGPFLGRMYRVARENGWHGPWCSTPEGAVKAMEG